MNNNITGVLKFGHFKARNTENKQKYLGRCLHRATKRDLPDMCAQLLLHGALTAEEGLWRGVHYTS